MSNLVVTEENKSLASPAMVAAMDYIVETLESVENPQIPRVKFKDDFTFGPDEEPVETFEAIILYAKNSNIYYGDTKYNPNNTKPPVCASSDAIKPDSGTSLQSTSCKECDLNKFGSAKDSDGKACKNMKTIYFRMEGDIIPKQISIPPTSIKYINKYLMDLASSMRSYMQVLTRFEVFKADAKQTHYNIRLVRVKDLSDDGFSDTKFVKKIWENKMRGPSHEEA